MKEVPKKDVPEVSGGYNWVDGGCIPDPLIPPGQGEDYPGNPGGPFVDKPYPYNDPVA